MTLLDDVARALETIGRRWGPDLAVLVGLLLCVAGVALVSIPAAVVVAGLVLTVGGLLAVLGRLTRERAALEGSAPREEDDLEAPDEDAQWEAWRQRSESRHAR